MEIIDHFDTMPDGLITLVEDYSYRSRSEEPALYLMTQISKAIQNGGRLWIVSKGDGKWAGYAVAEIWKDGDDKSCHVSSCYLNPEKVRPGLLRALESEISEWARFHGASQMIFATRRDPLVLRKVLSPGWKIDAVVMRRAL